MHHIRTMKSTRPHRLARLQERITIQALAKTQMRRNYPQEYQPYDFGDPEEFVQPYAAAVSSVSVEDADESSTA